MRDGSKGRMGEGKPARAPAKQCDVVRATVPVTGCRVATGVCLICHCLAFRGTGIPETGHAAASTSVQAACAEYVEIKICELHTDSPRAKSQTNWRLPIRARASAPEQLKNWP